MNPESVSVYVKEDQLHHNLDGSSSEQYSARSRSTTQSNICGPMSVLNCQPQRKLCMKKCRVSSLFCLVSLLVTTSVIFIHLLFYPGLKISYSPIISNSNYDFNVQDKTVRKVQEKELLSKNGRQRFPEKKLPQCIIIGVRKCGTQALKEFLNVHPMIEIATKETHFFDHDDKYALGLDWYRGLMPYSFSSQITVEKTARYFPKESVPARIHKMNPNIKLLLIVREPVIRLISEYTHTAYIEAEKGTLLPPFEDIVLRPNGTINTDYEAVMVGMYSLYFPTWISTFPRKQIHIVDGHNFILDPFSEIQKIESFLGLDHRVQKKNFYYNETKGFFCARIASHRRCLYKCKGRKHPDVSPEVVKLLRKFYQPYNKEFFRQARLNLNWPTE